MSIGLIRSILTRYCKSQIRRIDRISSHFRSMMSESGEGAPGQNVMALDDWGDKWKKGETGFHKQDVHRILDKYYDQLANRRKGMKVLVPLCGKTLDMKWFADKGHSVVGVEGVEQAILEFFSENNLEYTKETVENGELYKCKTSDISLYRCDFFKFNKSMAGPVDAVWDRGSLVAINAQDRERYSKLLKSVSSPDCRMLIVTMRYEENAWPGPPFLLPPNAVQDLYGDVFKVEKLEVQDALEERWKERGLTFMEEIPFLLQPK